MDYELEKDRGKIINALFGWINDNYDKVFLIVLGIAFLLRIWIFLKTYQQPLWWDAADYLSTAKRWGLGLNIRDIWYYRRGFLWPLISAGFFILGFGEKSIRFLEVLFSTGIVAVSYFLIKTMFNKKLALLSSIGLTASWILLFFTGRPLTSIPATFFLLLALLFFWKGYVLKQNYKFLYLFAIFYALAILIRMQYLLFALPFLVMMFSKEKFHFLKNKKIWIALLIFFIVLSPQIISYTLHYGNPVTDITRYYLGIGVPSQTGQINERTFSTIFNYLKEMSYILVGQQTSIISSVFNPLIYLFPIFLIGVFLFFINLILGFDKIFKSEELQKKLFIFFWILTLFFILGYITDYVEHRYVIPALPFIFMIAVYPIIKVGAFIQKQRISKKLTALIIFTILILLLIPSLIWTNQLTETKKISYLEVKQAGEWIKQNSNPQDIVITNSLPQITYYSERSTYPFDLGKTGSRTNVTRPEFEEFVSEYKPRYLIMSVFEVHEDWAQQYVQEHQQSLLKPIQGYYQEEQPVLIIYEFQYS